MHHEQTNKSVVKSISHPSTQFGSLPFFQEDNNINVVVAQSMLKRFGLRADTASNGVEAVRALAKKTYHMVMMDICMPRMDGLQATSAVRRFEETGVWRFDVLDGDLKELEVRV